MEYSVNQKIAAIVKQCPREIARISYCQAGDVLYVEFCPSNAMVEILFPVTTKEKDGVLIDFRNGMLFGFEIPFLKDFDPENLAWTLASVCIFDANEV